MQADTKVDTIDGDTYKVYMLDPLVASDLVADIGAIIIPSLAAISGNVSGDKDQLAEVLGNPEAPAPDAGNGYERAAVLFFQRFNKEKQREVIGILAKVTCLVLSDGKEPKLDSLFTIHFRGRIGAMYKWLGFALKVQFGDFFSDIVPGIQAVAQKMGRGL